MSVIVDDRDEQVQYHGQWAHHEGTATEYQSTTSASATRGDNITFTFEGTSIDVFGTAGSGNGATMKFSIDQLPSTSYTSPPVPSGSALYHQPLWTSGPLSDGSHTVLITQDSAGSQKSVIFLDYILYNATSTSGKTLFVDDSDPRVEYSPGWNATGLNGNFKDTAHVSTAAGCSVSLTFEGSFVSINGPIAFGKSGEGFNASVVIDGGSPSPITQQRPSNQPQLIFNNQLFTTSNLAPGNHTIIITALDDHPLVIDYFLFGDLTNTSGTAATATSIPPTVSVIGTGIPDSQPKTSISSQSSRSLDLPAIIGGAVGGLALIVLLILGLLFWRQRARATRPVADFRWVNRPVSVASSVTTLADAYDGDLPEAERKVPRYLSD
ncbi:hypothetical protein FB451DRAFT_1513693 [Mycena latifolia]|nr:hypothetical protein FB451DRAFT_1513693 [Mycena latifolia]